MPAPAAPPASSTRAALEDELGRARHAHERACRAVSEAMRDARLGRAIDAAAVEAAAEAVEGSVTRNAGALLGLARHKAPADYTFLHGVAAGVLMAAFARVLGLEPAEARDACIGGLLHDIGKAAVSEAVLDKPARLTAEEFALVRRHADEGHGILLRSSRLGEIPLDIARHHHERMD